MQQGSSFLLFVLVASSTIALQAEARPFYFYQAAEPAPPETAVESLQKDAQSATQQVTDQAKKLADQMGQHARQAQNYVQGAINSPQAQGITSHLGSLYEHGSSAMRSVMETVRPDISNLGHDLSDLASRTRDGLNSRIQPIGQTLRPYIDHAQKVVAPYVNQAKEEVPKLIEKAGPTLHKARESISSAWDKLSTSVSSAANSMTSQAQQGGEAAAATLKTESAPASGPAPAVATS